MQTTTFHDVDCNGVSMGETGDGPGYGPGEKKAKLDQRAPGYARPHKYCPETMFFFNLHRRKLRGVNIPKLVI